VFLLVEIRIVKQGSTVFFIWLKELFIFKVSIWVFWFFFYIFYYLYLISLSNLNCLPYFIYLFLHLPCHSDVSLCLLWVHLVLGDFFKRCMHSFFNFNDLFFNVLFDLSKDPFHHIFELRDKFHHLSYMSNPLLCSCSPFGKSYSPDFSFFPKPLFWNFLTCFLISWLEVLVTGSLYLELISMVWKDWLLTRLFINLSSNLGYNIAITNSQIQYQTRYLCEI
jgi:hypothetical protein